MKERAELIRAYVTGRYEVTELAQAFGVSRKTAHKWIRRFAEWGPDGLADRSHAAHDHPNATPQAVAAAVIRQKQAHPTWGPLKLRPAVKDPADIAAAWPAPSTRGAILARAGLTKSRRYRRRAPVNSEPFAACDRANAVWCADFKGWFRTGDGERCYPLTVSDAYSRMLLCCKSLSRANYDQVRPAFEAVFREYGLPDVIRTDNGAPFASVGAGGLSRLAVWWVKLGIRPERIEPGHPEQNGRHERMHLTLKQDCCQPPAATGRAQQRRFDEFHRVFNYERPHQALGLRPPATLYRPSHRPYPTKLEDPAYPPNTALRRVRTNGEIKWQGHFIFVSETLIRQTVGVVESTGGHEVYFGPILLGVIDPVRERLVRPRRPFSPLQGVTHAPS